MVTSLASPFPAAGNRGSVRAMLGGVDRADAARTVPAGLPPDVARDWVRLGEGGGQPAVFGSAAVSGLPEPVRLWLMHAIAEGAPLARSVELRMSGEIKLGRWSPFAGVERLSADGGFVWAATARPLGLPVRGFDRWTRGSGEMRWRLFGRVPVLRGSGADVTRSAAGRHAGELLLLLPTAALGPEVSWRSHDTHSAVATVQTGSDRHEVTVTVGPDGALTELVLQRWGPLGHGAYGPQPFGVTVHGELEVDGVRIPRRITAGWHYGTDRWPQGQFIRWTVEEARFG